MLLALVAYLGVRQLMTPRGRYALVTRLGGGSPARVAPLLDAALARSALDLELPPPAPALTCSPSGGGNAVCTAQIRLAPGVSTTQANARFTTDLLDLGARLLDGTEAPDKSARLRFAAGTRVQIVLDLVPAPPSGPDTVVTLGPNYPAVRVRTRLALIVEDYGVDLAQSRRVASLPGTFTAAVRPNIDQAARRADEARQKGMEVLVALPMEPRDYPTRNPGPGALLVDLSGRELRKRTREAFERVGPARGAITYMGQLAVEDADVMRLVLDEVRKQEAFFVDATESQFSTVPDLSRDMDIPFYVVDTVSEVDAGQRAAASIRIRLDALVEYARARGYGVGLVHARDATLDVLEERLPELAREGVVVMGLSEALKLHALE